MGTNVLVTGKGAREHTLIWKLRQSSMVGKIYACPGNAGTAEIAENLAISETDIPGLNKAIKEKNIGLVIPGPEASLVAGVTDECEKLGIAVFGPTKAAARIESSKVFAKELMCAYGIPCAMGEVFSTFIEAKRYVLSPGRKYPSVVKPDGLTAGKGVAIVDSPSEAIRILQKIMVERVFGDAGNLTLIDECLRGREVSLMTITDGIHTIIIPPACDYKRAYDGDAGPNTGGMGSYCPSEFLTPADIKNIAVKIVIPILVALGGEGCPYKGVLYTGLMMTAEGPKVLEFNARFGDPETQVQLPLLKSDLFEIMMAVNDGTLDRIGVEWSDKACVGVVIASNGYPDNPHKGAKVQGLDKLDGLMVFHAGTKEGKTPGEIEVSGGRILTVAATGKNFTEAREKVYGKLHHVKISDSFYRKDIALRPTQQEGKL